MHQLPRFQKVTSFFILLLKILHFRKLNNRIYLIHGTALRLVYKDYISSFDELLIKDNSFSNLQKLAIEIFKVKLGLAPEIMTSVFPIIKSPYDLKNKTKSKSRNVHTSIWH